MAGILGPMVHGLPSQLVLVEWGSVNDHIPAANETFDTGFFDVYWTAPNDLVSGDGVQVSSADPGAIAPGALRRAAVFLVDVWCSHTNAAELSVPFNLDYLPAPALVTAPFLAFTPKLSFRVQSGSHFSRTFRVRARSVRLRFTYPNANSTLWFLSAVLRSA